MLFMPSLTLTSFAASCSIFQSSITVCCLIFLVLAVGRGQERQPTFNKSCRHWTYLCPCGLPVSFKHLLSQMRRAFCLCCWLHCFCFPLHPASSTSTNNHTITQIQHLALSCLVCMFGGLYDHFNKQGSLIKWPLSVENAGHPAQQIINHDPASHSQRSQISWRRRVWTGV